jgi:aerobic carbon-monoxide dehydrogenase medium subunit
MLSKEFAFHAPEELEAALALLADGDGIVKVLAGGMSLVPAMNLGLVRPDTVLSLNRVRGLDQVHDDGGSVRLGAMVRHDRIAADPLIRSAFPLLAAAAAAIGDVQIRHRGTLGGSLAHADPAGDYLPVMAVLGATLRLQSSKGERAVAARDFFVDIMLTELRPDELIVEVEVPKLPPGARSSYLRLARVEGSFAIVNAAAVVAGGRPAIAIGGATGAPIYVEPDVDVSRGLSEEALDEIGEAVYAASKDAFGDLNSSAEYRRDLARVYARRAVRAALGATSS